MQQIQKEITETLKILQLQSSSSVVSMDTSCLLPVGRVKKSGWRTEVDDWRMCWNKIRECTSFPAAADQQQQDGRDEVWTENQQVAEES